VLYWVTTNLWTLGQQYFMFRNWTTEPVGALGGATTGGPPVRATQSSLRPGSARPAAGAAKTAGGARTGSAASGARTGSASGRTAAPGTGSARPKGSAASGGGGAAGATRTGSGSGGTRTGTASRPATAASRPATGQNGTEKRGLLRLGRAKPEPEPQDDVPTAKVVRQQPVRQAKSKRSGKR
jgi:YidC/Oxa1 family membrane protein insertase